MLFRLTTQGRHTETYGGKGPRCVESGSNEVPPVFNQMDPDVAGGLLPGTCMWNFMICACMSTLTLCLDHSLQRNGVIGSALDLRPGGAAICGDRDCGLVGVT